MKKEEIEITNKSCVKLNLKLNDYNILFGENNAGKSNILEGIREKFKSECNIIYIPDYGVNIEDHCKTSGPSSFREIITPIIKKILKIDKEINLYIIKEKGYQKLEDKIKEETFKLKEFVNNNIKNTNTKFDIDFSELSEKILLSIIKTVALDNFRNDEKVDIEQIGKGTQRLIIQALIRYLSEEKDEENERLNIVLFDEPELYLHPQLKKELHKSLVELSLKDNYQIIISTHDPYFVELSSSDEKIKSKLIKVYREKGETHVENQTVSSYRKKISFNQINYKVFNVDAENYHNELYGYLEGTLELKDEKEKIDKYIADKILNIEKRSRKDIKGCIRNNLTICSYIRHEIHHPTDGQNEYTEEDLKKSIEYLEEVIKKLKN